MVRVTLSGATKPIKETLKREGWKWDGRCWSKMITEEQAEACRNAVGFESQREAARAIKAAKKGCCLCIDGIPRYTSPTYVLPKSTGGVARNNADQDGFGWNVDAFGNPVHTRAIRGSSPDDCI